MRENKILIQNNDEKSLKTNSGRKAQASEMMKAPIFCRTPSRTNKKHRIIFYSSPPFP